MDYSVATSAKICDICGKLFPADYADEHRIQKGLAELKELMR